MLKSFSIYFYFLLKFHLYFEIGKLWGRFCLDAKIIQFTRTIVILHIFQINIPMLYLNAADDPLIPDELLIPAREAASKFFVKKQITFA